MTIFFHGLKGGLCASTGCLYRDYMLSSWGRTVAGDSRRNLCRAWLLIRYISLLGASCLQGHLSNPSLLSILSLTYMMLTLARKNRLVGRALNEAG